MTREEAKKPMPIIQAFADGKTIECRTKQEVRKFFAKVRKTQKIINY